MTTIRVSADTHSSGLVDELGASVPRGRTTLSDAVWADLRQWVDDYDPIIPMPMAERARRAASIEELDRRGLALLERVRSEWPLDGEDHPITFRYFSEGLLRFLD